MSLQNGKKITRQDHIDYLCSLFEGLRPFSRTNIRSKKFKPELESTDKDHHTYFKLQTRTHTEEHDSENWILNNMRIQSFNRYVRGKEGLKLYWLLTSDVVKESYDDDPLKFEDVYVLPWDAYKLARVNDGERNLTLSRLDESYTFEEHWIKDSNLWVVKDIEEEVRPYFNI